jgi:Spy/CpxP family protein refolding chaperone
MKTIATRRLGLPLSALAIVVLAAPQAWAQRQGGGFGGMGNLAGALVGLMSQKSVQDELKVSEEQAKQISALTEKQREVLGGLRDLDQDERRKKLEEQMTANKAAIAGILKEDQLKRLNQISLQLRGGRAFGEAEIAEALHLTSEQKDQVRTIQQDAQSQTRELRQGGDRTEVQSKLQAVRKSTGEKLMGILTSEQQGKWKELTSEPFKGELAQPGFRGRSRAGAGA